MASFNYIPFLFSFSISTIIFTVMFQDLVIGYGIGALVGLIFTLLLGWRDDGEGEDEDEDY